MNHHQIDSDLGAIGLFWNDEGQLAKIDFLSSAIPDAHIPPDPIRELAARVHCFFNEGEPLGEIPWDLLSKEGLSEFQWKVYQAITLIPHGETRTYSWVAMRTGNRLAGRAVGQALKKNPFPILIPCHRVVSTVSLGGFMGCLGPQSNEIKLKQKLLDLEYQYTNPLLCEAWA